MDQISIRAGEAGRTIRPKLGSGTVLYGVNLKRAFEARYGFLESPSRAEDFDLRERTIIFKHGYFEGRVIDKFEILAQGIRASGQIDTDMCDAFLNDAVEWAKTEAGIEFEDHPSDTVHVYTSVVELKMEGSIAKLAAPLHQIGASIGARLNTYNAARTDFEVSGVILWGDPANPGPGPVRLERRVNEPREANLYFSSAPLRTSHHIEILGEIERLMI